MGTWAGPYRENIYRKSSKRMNMSMCLCTITRLQDKSYSPRFRHNTGVKSLGRKLSAYCAKAASESRMLRAALRAMHRTNVRVLLHLWGCFIFGVWGFQYSRTGLSLLSLMPSHIFTTLLQTVLKRTTLEPSFTCALDTLSGTYLSSAYKTICTTSSCGSGGALHKIAAGRQACACLWGVWAVFVHQNRTYNSELMICDHSITENNTQVATHERHGCPGILV